MLNNPYEKGPIRALLSCNFVNERTIAKTASRKRSGFLLCWHYLSSRQVTLQVLSARTSLTSVFGMGTGGPSSQSIPTYVVAFQPLYVKDFRL